MLKKKTVFPPRPRPPNCEQILEDLSNSTHGDPAFLNKNSSLNGAEARLNQEKKQQLENWSEVKEFVECSRQIEQLQERLKGETEDLQTTEQELRQMAEEIKEQAMRALNRPQQD